MKNNHIKKIVDQLFRNKTNNSYTQLFRYTIVGGFAFIIDSGCLFLFTEYFHIHYLLSAGISFILGLIVNYSLSISWVFGSRNIHNGYIEFLIFLIIGVVGLGLNELFIWIFTEKLLLYYLISKILTAIIVYFWNFTARKIILFRKA